VLIVRYVHRGREACGFLDGDTVQEVDWNLRDLLVLAALGREKDAAAAPIRSIPRDQVMLLPPMTPGARIICIGLNYLEHQIESAAVFSREVPKDPVVFLKDASAMCGPESDLELASEVSGSLDWEVELGVVIGAPARAVGAARAWDVVAGYTVVNDISARDLQTKHLQWTLGKNVAGSTPMGPGIVPRDDIGTAPDLEIELRVNGEVKQSARTTSLIFSIPSLIESISRVMPLGPGDVIATGTPSGVGFSRTPPEFLVDGDLVEASVEGVGTLRNRVLITGGV
jgi:acylpyruvate hydrolase